MYSYITAISYILHKKHNYGRKWENWIFFLRFYEVVLYSGCSHSVKNTQTPNEKTYIFELTILILTIHF